MLEEGGQVDEGWERRDRLAGREDEVTESLESEEIERERLSEDMVWES